MGAPAVRTWEQAAARFWSQVDWSGGLAGACWPWAGARMHYRYGIVNWRLLGSKPVPAHRVAFRLAYGRWPRGTRHACDNPPCCNPFHLIEGSQADNMRDCIDRGRFRIGGRTSGTWTKGRTYNRWNKRSKIT